MNEIKDRVVDADTVWGSDFTDIRERMLGTKDINARFLMMENFLVSKFVSGMDLNPCVAFAISEMTERPDALNIARMNAQIGYSQKHFTEMFRKSVGVNPKSYLKIMRFQKAVRTIDGSSIIDWGLIAQDCGFYDQAHFINDFKHFSGFTPEQYAKINTNYQNYIPVG
jgi:AraC-like DNA-binding protein